jgi:phosphatidylglycerol:prolipoprotein diacylglycerol transferase
MLTYPEIDPVAIAIGPLAIRWYGLSYLFGFIGCYWLSIVRGRGTQWTAQKLADVLFYVAIGIILGGRVGYILFYHPSDILTNPLTALAFWEPGRSFHGGMLGVFLALLIYVKFKGREFITLMDFIAPSVPIGLGFGRLGNFINGELYGRVTNLPWGMVFAHAGSEPRHPSQLYEFFLEGVVLCLFLVWYARNPRKLGAVSGMFLIGYGIARCLVEIVREPDYDHSLFLNYLTMGQILSIPMIILGLYMIFRKEGSWACKLI